MLLAQFPKKNELLRSFYPNRKNRSPPGHSKIPILNLFDRSNHSSQKFAKKSVRQKFLLVYRWAIISMVSNKLPNHVIEGKNHISAHFDLFFVKFDFTRFFDILIYVLEMNFPFWGIPSLILFLPDICVFSRTPFITGTDV